MKPLTISASGVKNWSDVRDDVRRSVADFLVVPAATIAAFLFLAATTYVLDRASAPWLTDARETLERYFLTDASTAETLLSTLAGGMITVTSITFSMLLLAIQQSAAAFSTQVLDQFIRRRMNQFYFGVFVGVSLFTLLAMAANTSGVTPLFSALMALLLTSGALVLLIVLLYATLNQMRANRIIEAIHDLALEARERQQQLLSRTQRSSELAFAPVTRSVKSMTNGYIADLDLGSIESVVRQRRDYEIELTVCIGSYVCFNDVIAKIRAPDQALASELERAVLLAVGLERQRRMRVDPDYGVTQLATIGWTSASTAHSNPSPALSCLRNLRDLAARWSADPPVARAPDALAVVYHDQLLASTIAALESIGIAASESLQHRCAAEVLTSLADLFSCLPAELHSRTEDAALRQLSALGDHAPTLDVDVALRHLADSLQREGRQETARRVREALRRLSSTIGELNSRESRVSSSS